MLLLAGGKVVPGFFQFTLAQHETTEVTSRGCKNAKYCRLSNTLDPTNLALHGAVRDS